MNILMNETRSIFILRHLKDRISFILLLQSVKLFEFMENFPIIWRAIRKWNYCNCAIWKAMSNWRWRIEDDSNVSHGSVMYRKSIRTTESYERVRFRWFDIFRYESILLPDFEHFLEMGTKKKMCPNINIGKRSRRRCNFDLKHTFRQHLHQ